MNAKKYDKAKIEGELGIIKASNYFVKRVVAGKLTEKPVEMPFGQKQNKRFLELELAVAELQEKKKKTKK